MPNKPRAKAGSASTRRRGRAIGSTAGEAQAAWSGGLGALAKAQQEGVKVFESLLKQGQRFERRTREAAADTAAAARDAAAAKAREMQQIAGGTWDKLEQVFEERVARALSKLGIHTQNDVQRLAQRVDELADAVNRLLAASGAASSADTATAKRATKRVAKRPTKRPTKPATKRGAGAASKAGGRSTRR